MFSLFLVLVLHIFVAHKPIVISPVLRQCIMHPPPSNPFLTKAEKHGGGKSPEFTSYLIGRHSTNQFSVVNFVVVIVILISFSVSRSTFKSTTRNQNFSLIYILFLKSNF